MPPPQISPPPPSDTAGICTLSPDIIESHILTRLDGPSLASAASSATTLRHRSPDDHLWSDICHSTWPSTTTPRVAGVISTFPDGGAKAFFSRAFPLLSESRLNQPSSPPPPEILSAVDIHYRGNLIFTKLHETETETGWFLTSPFRIDLLEPKDMVPTPIELPETSSTAAVTLDGLTLSWIIIDPIGRRAANISSHEPVSVQRHWLTGEIQARFASILGGAVHCGILVTCGGSEGGELQVREVSLEIEDMDGKHLNGKDSLDILHSAMEGKKGTGKNRAQEALRRYRAFAEMRRERRERKLRTEGAWDTFCVFFGLSIFVSFWCYLYCR